jgi:hypothetical protein
MNNILFSLIVLVVLGYIFLHIEAQNKKLNQTIKTIKNETNQIKTIIEDSSKEESYKYNNETYKYNNENRNLNDSIVNRDYRIVYDPLAPASKRPATHVFPPNDFNRYIDIPTRGYPDSYQYLGNLFKVSGNTEIQGDKVVKLFGRQKIRGSNQYEYYGITNDSSTLNYKIPINTKNYQELFDGDIINIPQLGGSFNVNLHPDQTFRYNPDIL